MGFSRLVGYTEEDDLLLNDDVCTVEKKLLQSATDMFGDDHPDWIFQQDGAPCPTAKLCSKWSTDHNVTVLDWPGNSPDLNPIENLWRKLKKLVSAQRPSNKRELVEAVLRSWFYTITVQELKALVN